jgi:hypothetical protein
MSNTMLFTLEHTLIPTLQHNGGTRHFLVRQLTVRLPAERRAESLQREVPDVLFYSR